jgi:hypothetical protein
VRLVALALAALLLLGTRPAASAPASTVTVPLVDDGNHLFTEVRINGSEPLRFAIDTAGGQLIDAAVADRLGLRHGRTVRLHGVGDGVEPGWTTRVDRLAIGGAHLDDVGFIATPIAGSFGVAEGSHIDGIIGPALLAHFTVTVDPTAGTLTLAPPGTGPLGDVPLRLDDGDHPSVACRIENVATRCQLDTGSRLAITLMRPFLDANPAIAQRPQTADGIDGYGIGGPARGRLGYVGVTLAARTVHVVADYTSQTRGAFAHGEVGGNVGERVLRRFAVTYDLARGRASFTPNATIDAPDRVDRSGLFLVRRDTVTRVLDVRDGTPAALAGLHAGDELVAVDGRPATAFSLGAIRALLSDARTERVSLRVRDGTGERDVDLALANYVPSASEATAPTTAPSTGSAGLL